MRLSYLTFIARDVAALARFYADALGLQEVEASRDERYREVDAGGTMIGFASQDAYATLDLAEDAAPTGTRVLASFDVGAPDAVHPAVERASAHGGTLVKAPFDTPFGQHLAVMRDPEGNVFRLTAWLAR